MAQKTYNELARLSPAELAVELADATIEAGRQRNRVDAAYGAGASAEARRGAEEDLAEARRYMQAVSQLKTIKADQASMRRAR